MPAASLLAAFGIDPEGLLGAFAAALRRRGRHVVHVVVSPARRSGTAVSAVGPPLRVPVSRNPYHLITRALQPDTPRILFDLDRWDCAGGDIL